ncbi:hypothetical protein E2I00_014846 [Balaenoptera physalus]|uniref:Uncharacterized protein n=1 Tax=Balaenoptera physalus TaxID=9770 RepID=A0A643CEV7_BALPH|nr:hypothetical protein E2I00_014846 [Balaenoptera physalus]
MATLSTTAASPSAVIMPGVLLMTYSKADGGTVPRKIPQSVPSLSCTEINSLIVAPRKAMF